MLVSHLFGVTVPSLPVASVQPATDRQDGVGERYHRSRRREFRHISEGGLFEFSAIGKGLRGTIYRKISPRLYVLADARRGPKHNVSQHQYATHTGVFPVAE